MIPIVARQLDVESLRQLAERPPLFAPHEAPFWDDPHIAKAMLAAHLDPELWAASRPHSVIDSEVRWIVGQLGLEPGARVLDLGCGPGLYCERLQERGLQVTGVDLSPHSLNHARQHATLKRLAIKYLQANYTSHLDFRGEFDAVLIAYLDFAVLSDPARDVFLENVHRALRAGGAFVFDVPCKPVHREGAERWSAAKTGFWSDSPYLELTREFEYPEACADCQQTIVVNAPGEVRIYRIWSRSYSVATLAPVLAERGFTIESVWSDLTGQPSELQSTALGVIARKL